MRRWRWAFCRPIWVAAIRVCPLQYLAAWLRAGLSLRGLAEAIDHAVTARAIGRYERGEMLPGSEVAIRLARALEVPLSYLFSPSDIRLEGLEFRKTARTSAKDRAQVESAVLDHLDRYLQIEELLGRSTAEIARAMDGPGE